MVRIICLPDWILSAYKKTLTTMGINNSRIRPTWALTQDIICYYIDPMKSGAWVLTQKWVLAQNTMVCTWKLLILLSMYSTAKFMQDKYMQLALYSHTFHIKIAKKIVIMRCMYMYLLPLSQIDNSVQHTASFSKALVEPSVAESTSQHQQPTTIALQAETIRWCR